MESVPASESTPDESVNEPETETPKTLIQALEAARNKLLDRSLRNKLIHTNVASTKARQIRIIDELSDEIFKILRAGKTMTFVAGSASRSGGDDTDQQEDELYVPPTDDEVVDGIAARHRDQKLQTRLTPEGLQRKLLGLFYEGQTIEEEQGVNVLFLALGFLRWQEAKKSEVDRFAPLVLLPVELIREGARDRFKLRLRPDDLYTNVSLQAWLKEQFNIALPDVSDTEEFSASEYHRQVAQAIGSRQGWEVVKDEICLGFFSFSKFLLWRDLDPTNWPSAKSLLDHPLLRDILLRHLEETEPQDSPLVDEDQVLDDVFKPADLTHITDADSSQAIAIQEALAERNLVIQGPPGTGKSQTITNLIAGAVKRGKSVLFIAEKMAALDVVHSRLVKAKLRPICLELHSRKASKVQFLEQLRTAMTAPPPPAWSPNIFREVEESQQVLRDHTNKLHKSGPNGFAPFELIGHIALLKALATPTPDFEVPAAQAWSRDELNAQADQADALASRLLTAGIPLQHPWRGCGIRTPDLLEQDRLRPTVQSLATAALLLVAEEQQARTILNRDAPLTIGEFDDAERALNHMAKTPPDCDDLLVSDRVSESVTELESIVDLGERLANLNERFGAHRALYDYLCCDDDRETLRLAWACLSHRPSGCDDLLIADPLLQDPALGSCIECGETFYAETAALRASVIEAAFDQDWLTVRRTIAAHGRSWLRWFSSEYRSALRELSSVCQGPLSKSVDEKLSVLDRLIRRRQLNEELEALQPAIAFFGARWRGPETDWAYLRSLNAWAKAAAVFEPEIHLRSSRAFELADASPNFAQTPAEQAELLSGVAEIVRIERELCDRSEQIALLGEHWQSKETDWSKIRSALEWVRTAKSFEPLLNLRRSEVIVHRASAAAHSESLHAGTAETLVALDALTNAVKLNLDETSLGGGLNQHTSADVYDISSRWLREFERITEWPPVRQELARIAGEVSVDLSDRILDGRVSAAHLKNTLLLSAYEAIWQRLRAAEPHVENAAGDDLHRQVVRFRSADEGRIKIASDEVSRAHVDRCPTGSAGAVGIIKDETKKSRRLKPVRKLMDEAGEAVQRFKPVFLMSPLSVAQFLAPGRLEFDLCVIDEASQVRPEDALGAIARCKQLVVVGDEKQLPPTSFFSRMINDLDEPDEDREEITDQGTRAAAVKDVESILNLCSRFPERMLRWHYRSEHPSLIATSNRNFYRNELLLPPSVISGAGDGNEGLVFHKVAEGGYERGRTARNEIEAEALALAVAEHAEKHPDQSLGIGTFSVAQRDAIRDRLDIAASKNPDLDNFLRRGVREEKVFVKNLENIQGDERDVILISVGYGRDKDGRLTQQFGPVGRDGGERRLNVLITRARKRCEVFSSIVAEDIKMAGAPKPGVAALREFLKLARDGFADVPEETGKGFDSDFEESVAIAVEAMGYQVHPQVGMAGFFVDLGVVHPQHSNKYVLGIECDGAAYHSSRFARDRDRLRQHILEKRGWQMHRIWSTDWFYRQERELAKLRDALEKVVAGQRLPDAEQTFASAIEIPGAVQTALELEDAIPPSISRGLPPYRLYSQLAPERFSMQPHQLSAARLGELVVAIVEIEQPIHQEEVARRLATSFGLQRAGGRIQQVALQGLRYAERKGQLKQRKSFWGTASSGATIARDRSSLPSASTARKPELICSTEIAEAIVRVLRESLALTSDELIVETARAFGFARTGGDVATSIRKALKSEMDGRIKVDHLGRIALA